MTPQHTDHQNGRSHPERYGHARSRGRLSRRVTHRSGRVTESSVPVGSSAPPRMALGDAYDYWWLRLETAPKRPSYGPACRVADLFSGCGAMSLGVQEACRALGTAFLPVLAADLDPAAEQVYRQNFPDADFERTPLQLVVDQPLGAKPSATERALRRRVGTVDILVGGPPCQGHSDLNNHTRRVDSKNALFDRMARFAQLVQPTSIIIENVAGVRHDENGVFDRTAETLAALGYHVHFGLLDADQFGVAQRRRRLFLIGTTNSAFSVDDLLHRLPRRSRTFDWACGDLGPPNGGIHRAATPTHRTKARNRLPV